MSRILVLCSCVALTLVAVTLSIDVGILKTHAATALSAGCPGDFNGDGKVNLADFLAFAGAFGTRSGEANYNTRMDADSSGSIDLSDFLAFAGVFGTTCGDRPDGSFSHDRAALVALYNATDGPNWVNNTNWLTDAPLGKWYGVETDASGRVVSLDLTKRKRIGERSYEILTNGLSGQIPPELGSLVELRILRLDGNQLTGPIPPELGDVAGLEQLNLWSNNLTGPIPSELGKLANLQELNLGINALTGPIPPELGELANLQSLNLSINDLTGPIPPQLGNLVNLTDLGIAENDLTGPIPPELGNLANLWNLFLSINNLTGPIPPELGNLANLRGLDLRRNALAGPIPISFLQIETLEQFRIEGNEGLCVPGTSLFFLWLQAIEHRDNESENFCNAADIAALRLLYQSTDGAAWNESAGWPGDGALEGWHGVTADALGRVTMLDLSRNGLAGRLPAGVANLAQLTELRIDGNTGLSGRLPLSLAHLPLRTLHYTGTGLCAPVDGSFRGWLSAVPSHEGTGADCAPPSDREILEALYQATDGPNWTSSDNWLTDTPIGEWHGVRAESHGRVLGLYLGRNGLAGRIPAELGSLTSMAHLELGGNALTGPIPPELGRLINLRSLRLFFNQLSGAIPPELGHLASLEQLSLGGNPLTGSIPAELGGLANLTSLYLFDSRLTGNIPAELGRLGRLKSIVAWGNQLSGAIPAELGNLAALELLYLDGNALSGPVPAELGKLSAVETLVLSNNNLSGSIPPEFGRMSSLRELSLANNAGMSGPLPNALTELGQLEVLRTTGTGLCTPADPNFVVWLEGIHTRRINRCTEAVPPTAYLTQAVQSREFPVPLVAGEKALLRVFPTARQATGTGLPAVRARFYVNGQETHVEDIAGSSTPIPTDVDESDLSTSPRAEIPGHLVQPGLEMLIEVDGDGTLDPALGVATRIPEIGRLAVEVWKMPRFDLTLIPFIWSRDPDSSIVDLIGDIAADPENHEMLGETRTLLPVGDLAVTAHEPVLSSSNNLFVIRDETKAIRAMEGGTSHYMGMMAGPLTGGSVGVADLPGRVSFSRPVEGTIAHELGHNMNLRHAPCRNTPGVDPAYPYPDGSIGVWGYDFEADRLVLPYTWDRMGYCGPNWISDYHFSNALRYRLFDEGRPKTAAARSLLLWGGVDAEGKPHQYPAFVVDAPAALPDSVGGHLIAGLTGGGEELFSISFTMPETADGDGSSSYAFVLPVQPGWADKLASITLSGPVGVATLDKTTDRPMAILRDLQTGQVRGFMSDLSARDATQAAEGAFAAKPGVEVLFSRGIPDLR